MGHLEIVEAFDLFSKKASIVVFSIPSTMSLESP